MKDMERIEIGRDRFCPFDMENSGEPAIGDGTTDVVGRPANLYCAIGLSLDCEKKAKHRQSLVQRLGLRGSRKVTIPIAGLIRRRNEHCAKPACKPAATRARQIDMPRSLAIQKGVDGIEAIAPQPQQHIIVAVEYWNYRGFCHVSFQKL
jgi:hypothetical protein